MPRYTELAKQLTYQENIKRFRGRNGDAGEIAVDGDQPRQRRVVHYNGHVQGVGFRFTVERIAGQFQVDGFVKNLPEGRVLLVVEGVPKELDRFLAEIQAEMAGNIRTIAVAPGQANGEFSGFGIRY